MTRRILWALLAVLAIAGPAFAQQTSTMGGQPTLGATPTPTATPGWYQTSGGFHSLSSASLAAVISRRQTLAAVGDPTLNTSGNLYVVGNVCTSGGSSCTGSYTLDPMAAIAKLDGGTDLQAVAISANDNATAGNAFHDLAAIFTGTYSGGQQFLQTYGAISGYYAPPTSWNCTIDGGTTKGCMPFNIIGNTAGTYSPGSHSSQVFFPVLGISEIGSLDYGTGTILCGQVQTGEYQVGTRGGGMTCAIYHATTATDGNFDTESGAYDPFTTSINTYTHNAGYNFQYPIASNAWIEYGMSAATASSTGTIALTFPTGLPGAGQVCTMSFATSTTVPLAVTNAIAAFNASSGCTAPTGHGSATYKAVALVSGSLSGQPNNQTIGIELNGTDAYRAANPSGIKGNCSSPATPTQTNVTLGAVYCDQGGINHTEYVIGDNPSLDQNTAGTIDVVGYYTAQNTNWLTTTRLGTGPSGCMYLGKFTAASITGTALTVTDFAGNHSGTVSNSHTAQPPYFVGNAGAATSTYAIAPVEPTGGINGNCGFREEDDPNYIMSASHYPIAMVGGVTTDTSGNAWIAYAGYDSSAKFRAKVLEINGSTLAQSVPGSNWVDPSSYDTTGQVNVGITRGASGSIYYGVVASYGADYGCTNTGPCAIVYKWNGTSWAKTILYSDATTNTSTNSFGGVTVSADSQHMFFVWTAGGGGDSTLKVYDYYAS